MGATQSVRIGFADSCALLQEFLAARLTWAKRAATVGMANGA
jgi:hypothetical protein